jgi:hypothetical protein
MLNSIFEVDFHGCSCGFRPCRSQTSRLPRIIGRLPTRFRLPAPRITRPDDWLPVSPGRLLGRAGRGKAARPVP